MRRLRLILTAVVIAGMLPTAVYEALQKTAEAIGPRAGLLRLSCEAERRTGWRPRSGISALDHVQHELAESRLFWQLTAQHAVDRSAAAERFARSALSFPVEIARR